MADASDIVDSRTATVGVKRNHDDGDTAEYDLTPGAPLDTSSKRQKTSLSPEDGTFVDPFHSTTLDDKKLANRSTRSSSSLEEGETFESEAAQPLKARNTDSAASNHRELAQSSSQMQQEASLTAENVDVAEADNYEDDDQDQDADAENVTASSTPSKKKPNFPGVKLSKKEVKKLGRHEETNAQAIYSGKLSDFKSRIASGCGVVVSMEPSDVMRSTYHKAQLRGLLVRKIANKAAEGLVAVRYDVAVTRENSTKAISSLLKADEALNALLLYPSANAAQEVAQRLSGMVVRFQKTDAKLRSKVYQQSEGTGWKAVPPDAPDLKWFAQGRAETLRNLMRDGRMSKQDHPVFGEQVFGQQKGGKAASTATTSVLNGGSRTASQPPAQPVDGSQTEGVGIHGAALLDPPPEYEPVEAAEDYIALDGANDVPPPPAERSLLWQLNADERHAQSLYYGIHQEDDSVRCMTCAGTGHMTEVCPSRTCQHCQAVDEHFASACPKMAKCSKCQERGHEKAKCPYKLARSKADGFQCDLCNETGHTEDECSFLWRTYFPGKLAHIHKVPKLRVVCYQCGSDSHWGDDCSQRNKRQRISIDTFSAKNASWYLTADAPASKGRGKDSKAASRGQGFSIRGRAQSPISIVSDDDDEPANFYGRKITREPPRGGIRINTGRPPRNANRYEPLLDGPPGYRNVRPPDDYRPSYNGYADAQYSRERSRSPPPLRYDTYTTYRSREPERWEPPLPEEPLPPRPPPRNGPTSQGTRSAASRRHQSPPRMGNHKVLGGGPPGRGRQRGGRGAGGGQRLSRGR